MRSIIIQIPFNYIYPFKELKAVISEIWAQELLIHYSQFDALKTRQIIAY